MKTILLVDDDKKFHSLVIDGLKAYGSVTTRETKDLIVKAASNGNEAVNVLSRFKVDLIVTDIQGPDGDDFELLAHMKQAGVRDIPIIVVTAAGGSNLKVKLKEMGVTHHLKKPFVLLELLEKMLDVLDESSKALISDFTVPNFVQALQMEEKTCSLRITAKDKVGYLHLDAGELIDAETDGVTGTDAAIEVLGWEDTELEVEELSSKQKRIRASMMQILMQAAQVKDEKAAEDDTSEPAFDEIVALAEGLHLKKAQDKLTAFLKANMKSEKGWLWYSRITNKMTLIDKALTNAGKIAPDDPEVQEEINKIEEAKKVLDGGPIWRCPFCWAPLNVETSECSYCSAYLLVDENLLTRLQGENKRILQQAVERYNKVVAGDTTPEAHYYLAMAHLNLGHWERGLDELNKTVEAYPEKDFYEEQLQMLMNVLASNEDLFDQDEDIKEIGSDQEPTTVADAGEKKILVAEGSPTIRKAVSVALSKRGYQVIEAEDGLEVLNRLDKTKPDVILMDITLPKIDTQKILWILADSTVLREIPVIILTNEEGLVGRLKRKMAGAKALLPKPINMEKVLETIESCLEQ